MLFWLHSVSGKSEGFKELGAVHKKSPNLDDWYWLVELNSLEDLIKLIKDCGHEVIMTAPPDLEGYKSDEPDLDLPSLKIYDGYME